MSETAISYIILSACQMLQTFTANNYQAYSYEDFHEKCSNNFKMDDI